MKDEPLLLRLGAVFLRIEGFVETRRVDVEIHRLT
jgi:hypothetical protein